MSALWERQNVKMCAFDYTMFAICDIEQAEKEIKYQNEWRHEMVWMYLTYAKNNIEVAIFKLSAMY